MAPPETRPTRKRRARPAAWLQTAAGLLVLVAVIGFVVLPRMAGSGQALELLERVQPGWVLTGIVLEALSLISYSLITRRIIREHPPTFSWLLRSDLTGYGVGRVVPGGGATATALRYRLLVSGGARPESVTTAIAAQGIGCAVALAAVFWIVLIPAVVWYGPSTTYVVTWLIGSLLAACGVVAAHERFRLAGPARRALGLALRAVPHRWRPRITEVAGQLGRLVTDREARRAFALWAVLNWVLDAAALWIFLTAYGHPMNPVALLLAYCLASLLAILPITPGGLGVIEGVLIPTLLGFGVPAGVAALGVVSWRLFQFWLPVPVAGLCYLSLRTPGWRTRAAARRRTGNS
ncbi:YbhN family protein [Kribbella sp. NPDC020789]